MQSMTGMGLSKIKTKNYQLDVCVKSVNSRFLNIKFYTPSQYAFMESEFRQAISKKCQRGAFTVLIERYPTKNTAELNLLWNTNHAKKWQKIYSKIAKTIKTTPKLTAENLISRQGVVQCIEKPQSLSKQEERKVKQSFHKAFNNCLQERKREGLALKKDILSLLKLMQSRLQTIKRLNEKQKIKYRTKKTTLLQKKENTDQALEMEKFDIQEEVIRIKEHLKHFKSIMLQPAALGKKMDFYIQEILRETNTIGSKSQQPGLTLQVVEGKFILEQIKEQIQNIE